MKVRNHAPIMRVRIRCWWRHAAVGAVEHTRARQQRSVTSRFRRVVRIRGPDPWPGPGPSSRGTSVESDLLAAILPMSVDFDLVADAMMFLGGSRCDHAEGDGDCYESEQGLFHGVSC
jgi:hypothetical protein